MPSGSRFQHRLLLALLCLLTACTGDLVVLGDSNSCWGFWPCRQGEPNWPAVLQQKLDDARVWWRVHTWRVDNWSVPGLTAGRFPNADGSEPVNAFSGEPNDAGHRLDQLLTERQLAAQCRRVFSGPAPKLVIAVGTNDVGTDGRAPRAVTDDILALRSHALAVAPCLTVYVALLPPRYSEDFTHSADIDAVNAALRASVAPERIVDFFTGFTRADFVGDGVHLTSDGFRKRAERAFPVLFPELAGDAE